MAEVYPEFLREKAAKNREGFINNHLHISAQVWVCFLFFACCFGLPKAAGMLRIPVKYLARRNFSLTEFSAASKIDLAIAAVKGRFPKIGISHNVVGFKF